MIRLTLDDGSILGPMIGVTVDTIGDPLSWQTIPVDILKTVSRQVAATQVKPASPEAAHTSVAQPKGTDSFFDGPPFSVDDIVQRIGIIGNKRLSMAIATRGISFTPGDSDFERLRKAGAGIELVQAVAEANRVPSR